MTVCAESVSDYANSIREYCSMYLVIYEMKPQNQGVLYSVEDKESTKTLTKVKKPSYFLKRHIYFII